LLNSFIRGLRLGIILQLSIGPVCLFILQTAIARGITEALYTATGERKKLLSVEPVLGNLC